MKKLADGREVSARSYYYLLDWNERDEWRFMCDHLNKHRLCDLNIKEYTILWLHATTTEHIWLEDISR